VNGYSEIDMGLFIVFLSSNILVRQENYIICNQYYVINRNIKLNALNANYDTRAVSWDNKLEEEKVVNILTDEKLSAIKAMLEKDHAIDCIFLLHLDKGRWKNAKAFMQELKLTLSDGTFRSRMMEIEKLGLAKSVPIDPLKKYYVKTEFGEKVAKLLLEFFEQVESFVG